jgi:hypothetical protein
VIEFHVKTDAGEAVFPAFFASYASQEKFSRQSSEVEEEWLCMPR